MKLRFLLGHEGFVIVLHSGNDSPLLLTVHQAVAGGGHGDVAETTQGGGVSGVSGLGRATAG